MRMELRDVEYFAVVAKHRHIGRAAESLGLGQPALSKSLRRLELAAKTRLLVRTPKGVEPTAAGAALLSRIHRLRLAFDDVTQEVSDIGQGRVGHLRIGAIAGCVEYPLAPACRLIMQEAPELTVNVTADPVDVLIPLLLNGEFDLLVIPQFPTPRQEIIQEYLFEDRFGVIASEEHKLVKRKAVKLAELTREKWILSSPGTMASRQLFRVFEDNGLPSPEVAMRTTSIPLRDILVATTNMLGHSSTRMARAAMPHARLAEIHVSELEWVRRICIAYRRDAYLPRPAARLIEILKSIVRTKPVR